MEGAELAHFEQTEAATAADWMEGAELAAFGQTEAAPAAVAGMIEGAPRHLQGGSGGGML